MRIAHATLLLLPALSACSLGGTPQTIGSLPPPTADTTTADAPLTADPDRAIASYRAYLRDAPPGERRTEAQRRLADLTLERAADEDAASGGGDGPVVPTEVITLYRRLLRENPDGPDSDRIRYQLARALEYNGKREAAVAVLDALVTDNPDSPHYAEAQFRRAEALFSNGKFRSAEAAYTKVAALGPGTGYYDQALYKQGWSRFRQHHLNEAVTAFLELYALETDNGRLSEDALSSARQQRLADTLRAVSLAFAYQSGAASAKDYFQRHGNVPFEDRVYARLGRHYLHEEAWSAAAATYNTFAAEHPLHERAPLFRVKGIDAWSQGGFPGQVLKAKEAFARDYGIPSAFWEKHEPGKHPKVVAALKDTTAELARHYHAAAQDGGDAEDYRQATAWYRRYIEAFPDDARTPGLNFLLAELLFETERYAQATVEYEHTAYGYGDNPRAAEAGYAAILAYQRQAERLEAEELDAWHQQQTDSELRFADAFPDHPQAPQVLARAAKSLYERGDRRGAAKAADRFLQRYPDSSAELRRSAFLVAGHSRFELGEYAKAESAYTDALPLTPEAEQAPVKERLAASIYKQGEALREQGKLRAAVKDFLRLGRVVPDADMRPTAEYDAAAALLKLEAWDEAIPVLEGFRRRYPDNELTPEITRRLAVAQLKSGNALAAASEFRRIGDGDYSPQVRREALMQAADLYESSERPRDSIDALTHYVARFPEPVEPAVEARQRIAALYGKLGDGSKRLAWLRKVVEAHESAGEAGTDRTRYLAAQASMILADDSREAYAGVSLTAPIRENLRTKKRLMQAALKDYTRAAGYAVADFTTEATFRIASLYYDFSRALLDSERPAELDGEALDQYEIMLEEQAFPFEEKAIHIHEVNAARVTENIYDEWVRRSFGQLAALVPARYAKREISHGPVESLE